MGKPGVVASNRERHSYRSLAGARPCGMVRLGKRPGTGWRYESVTSVGEPSDAVTLFRPDAGVHVRLWPDGVLTALRPDFLATRFARAVRRRRLPDFPRAQFLGAVERLAHHCRPLLRDPESAIYLCPDMTAENGPRRWVFQLSAYLLPSAFATGFAPLYLRWDAGMLPHGLHLCWVDAAQAHLVLAPVASDDVSVLARASVASLAPRWGLRVRARQLSVAQWYRLNQQGRVSEAFVCGGPALVQQVGRIGLGDQSQPVGSGQPGPTVIAVRRHLFRLQQGQAADPNRWMLPLR
ncbi:hypothetical protein [Streptomyces capitiformicae]|uniref:Uncharacterized protein n=1 Tax=Streptomyces capitiformicae TaxID=2014920 RepID=A0A918Z2B3_9ACTN|nr:hypothetical protein [Streptomyces capitiformicae]GHE34651.1 hypothetical protein GCM10017771_52360 [Streptomyces capitiformicae]